jgi:hypothetical protein
MTGNIAVTYEKILGPTVVKHLLCPENFTELLENQNEGRKEN